MINTTEIQETEKTWDTIEQVNAIKYILKEEYWFNEKQNDGIISQCIWRLAGVLEDITMHAAVSKTQEARKKIKDLFEILNIEETKDKI